MFLNQFRALRRLSAVRLTLSLLLVFGAVTVIAWIGTFILVEREMDRLVDTRLEAQLAAVNAALDADEDLPQPGFGQEISVTIGGETLGFLSIPIQRQADGIYEFEPEDDEAPDYRYLIQNRGDGRIIVAEKTERQGELRGILSAGMWVSLIGTLAAGLIAGVWLAFRGQRRLDRIGAGLARVAEGDLDTVISLPGRTDDLTLLADRTNATTARLKQVVEQMRVQSSNIAHDLRTPLARLRAQIETNLLALSENGKPVSVDDLGAALEQIDTITGTFNALLRLARIEDGEGKAAFAPVDLGSLAQQVSATFGPVIEDAGQSLDLQIADDATITGDHDLLVQLVANLIQNALRYGPDGQSITLSIAGTQLSVCDQGPGIPAANRVQVLQPLFQLESARQNDGFGLGLSMVRAICKLHDADLTLADGPNGRGLAVMVEFPN